MDFSGINLNLDINLWNYVSVSRHYAIHFVAAEVGTIRLAARALFCSSCHRVAFLIHFTELA